MQSKSWPEPQADLKISGKSVEIYSLNPDDHLIPLFEAACVQNNGVDIFKYNLSCTMLSSLIPAEVSNSFKSGVNLSMNLMKSSIFTLSYILDGFFLNIYFPYFKG